MEAGARLRSAPSARGIRSWMVFYTSDLRRASDAADQVSGHLSKQSDQHPPPPPGETAVPARSWSSHESLQVTDYCSR